MRDRVTIRFVDGEFIVFFDDEECGRFGASYALAEAYASTIIVGLQDAAGIVLKHWAERSMS